MAKYNELQKMIKQVSLTSGMPESLEEKIVKEQLRTFIFNGDYTCSSYQFDLPSLAVDSIQTIAKRHEDTDTEQSVKKALSTIYDDLNRALYPGFKECYASKEWGQVWARITVARMLKIDRKKQRDLFLKAQSRLVRRKGSPFKVTFQECEYEIALLAKYGTSIWRWVNAWELAGSECNESGASMDGALKTQCCMYYLIQVLDGQKGLPTDRNALFIRIGQGLSSQSKETGNRHQGDGLWN
ncbi:MAG: hypothetical protein ABF969_01105 [Sporolactobacillus sp.]